MERMRKDIIDHRNISSSQIDVYPSRFILAGSRTFVKVAVHYQHLRACVEERSKSHIICERVSCSVGMISYDSWSSLPLLGPGNAVSSCVWATSNWHEHVNVTGCLGGQQDNNGRIYLVYIGGKKYIGQDRYTDHREIAVLKRKSNPEKLIALFKSNRP